MPPKKSLCQRMTATATRDVVNNTVTAQLWDSETKEASILRQMRGNRLQENYVRRLCNLPRADFECTARKS